MDKKLFIFFLMVPLINACGNSESKSTFPPIPIAKARQLQLQNFDTVIGTIDKNAGDLTAPVELFFLEEFRAVFEHPNLFVDTAVAYLADSLPTHQQKLIVIYSMQKLSGEPYVNYISKMSGLYTNTLIDDRLVISILYPEIHTRNKAADYRKNEKFVTALESIKNSSHSSDYIRKSVDHILGKD